MDQLDKRDIGYKSMVLTIMLYLPIFLLMMGYSYLSLMVYVFLAFDLKRRVLFFKQSPKAAVFYVWLIISLSFGLICYLLLNYNECAPGTKVDVCVNLAYSLFVGCNVSALSLMVIWTLNRSNH